MPLIALGDHDDRSVIRSKIIELDARDLGATEARVKVDRDDRAIAQVDGVAAIAPGQAVTNSERRQLSRSVTRVVGIDQRSELGFADGE